MSRDDPYARTVRITIPFQDSEKKTAKKIPKAVLKKRGLSPTPWEVISEELTETSPYQELLQSLYDGVLITDLSGRIVDVNDRAIDFLLYDKDELSRLNIVDIIIGADDTLLATLRRNIENHRHTLIEAYCIRKDQTTFPAEIAANRLVLTQEGHLCFFVRDITRRKKAEEELIQTISRLKELDTSKSRFVSNVSHELRTPLTIINTFVSLVNDGVAGPVSEQQKECLTTVLRNCARLAGLIEDILDLGRIESGREEFRRRRVDLMTLLQQCHHDFLPKCLFSHQQLTLEIPHSLPEVLCDRDKIAQVLTNLVGNANKFTPENGSITLRGIHDGDWVRLEVEDNGPGIRLEDQGRIFEAFTQINRPEGGSGSKGTGLGLAISKHIINIHEGIIQVDSTPGKGSRFYFTLPTYTEEKTFDAFIKDRLRFLEARNQQMTMLVLQVSGTQIPSTTQHHKDESTLLQRIQSSAMEALNCAEEQVFVFETTPTLVFLLDGTDLKRDILMHCLQRVVSKKWHEEDGSIRVAYVEPTPEYPPQEWLKKALILLEPLPLGPIEIAPRRVLIVDDDASILNIMVRVLNESGDELDLKSTTSGYDACIHFGELKPDLVVLDLHLRDIDGKRVFESMTKSHPRRDTKFLVVSGYRGDIDEMMKLGCDDFLCKPFDFDEFVSKVKRLLNLAS